MSINTDKTIKEFEKALDEKGWYNKFNIEVFTETTEQIKDFQEGLRKVFPVGVKIKSAYKEWHNVIKRGRLKTVTLEEYKESITQLHTIINLEIRKFNELDRGQFLKHSLYARRVSDYAIGNREYSNNLISDYVTYHTESGIYYLYNKDEVVYIGKSNKLGKRVIQSVQGKNVDSYSIVPIPNQADRDILEVYLINKHKPKYNKDCNSSDIPTINLGELEEKCIKKIYKL